MLGPEGSASDVARIVRYGRGRDETLSMRVADACRASQAAYPNRRTMADARGYSCTSARRVMVAGDVTLGRNLVVGRQVADTTSTQVVNSGTDPRLDPLRACGAALRRESHVLRERPELTWQQLYNRLQWEGSSLARLLEPQMQRRSAPGASLWIHTRTRLRESDALRFVLTGHTEVVNSCAISPDSSYIVTVSHDNTSRIWDAVTGVERATLTGHTSDVLACAISPDSSYVVTASWDQTARIWDAATGRELASLPLHGPSACAALHPWRPFAVCGDWDGSVYLMDMAGIEYGPIVVTAVDLGNGAGPAIRCPKCLQLHPVNEAWLGKVIECPTSNCELSLRVNPFVTRMA